MARMPVYWTLLSIFLFLKGSLCLVVDVPSPHIVSELGLVDVMCNVTNNPDNNTVVYRWIRDNHPNFEIRGQNLRISQVTSDDSGIYRCQAVMGEKSGTAPCEVIVYFSPRWELNKPTKFAGDISSRASLECLIRALPDPSFYWSQNGNNITSGGNREISSAGNRSVLTIHSVSESDYGDYTCHGYNEVGTGAFNLQLLKPGIPDSPQLCELVSVAERNATITCLPGYQGGEELNFEAYKTAINVEKEKVRSSFEMAGDMALILVLDLYPNSTYTVLIYQQNSHGESEESIGVFLITEGGPPLPPNDPMMLIIIICAVCGGTLLVAIIIGGVAFAKCRNKGAKESPRFNNKKDTDTYVMEDSSANNMENANQLSRKNSWGSFKRSKKMNGGATDGMPNKGYQMSSKESLNPQLADYENAPTLPRPRPYMINIGPQPGESNVGYVNDDQELLKNSMETSFHSGTVTPSMSGYDQEVILRRQLADPTERAKRLSNGQPSLAGMGALSMLPDPTAAMASNPMRPSISPATTPTHTNIARYEEEFRTRTAPPSFEPEVPWEFPREKLYIRTKLGEGAFGEVWRARAEGICGRKGKQLVAVKMLKEYSTPEERRTLLKELAVMKVLQPHPNVIMLLGCCTKSDPLCIIMDYAANGNLENLLRKQRAAFEMNNLSKDGSDGNPNRNVNLTARDLVIFCLHVASGMEYISSKDLLHRDLAARNILVDEKMICKIGDFGSARDIIESRQYESQTQRRLPIRWMAPESLLQTVYSPASDAWSFGVLMWEIVTLGSTPYPGMSGPDVMNFVQKGCRMQKPNQCSDALYALMKDCWNQFPPRRPQFSLIRHRLVAILDEPDSSNKYVDEMEDSVYDILPSQPGEKC